MVGALLEVYPFRTLYIADLDAIQRRGSHTETITRIRRRFPHVELWVDSGIADAWALQAWLDSGLGIPVIGSESVADANFMLEALQRSRAFAPVLSLDFRGASFQGPAALLSDPATNWPRRVLAMNLARVGSDSGPDLALIARLIALAPDRDVFAAGGIRSAADLEQVARAGGAGALLATARRAGPISGADRADRNSGV